MPRMPTGQERRGWRRGAMLLNDETAEVIKEEMPEPQTQAITIAVDETTHVSGLLNLPPRPSACFVFAHGAGAGMAHPFMAAAAAGVAERGMASLRYQFPYLERGGKRPD